MKDDVPRWASGLSDASLVNVGGEWKATGPDRPITITFTDHNSVNTCIDSCQKRLWHRTLIP
jgi:hypothetical protein